MKGLDSEMIPPAGTGKKVLSVSELTREIKSLLENRFSHVWVEGEISGFKHHQSGHIYFSLKDDKALLKAVFFSRYHHDVRFDLEDGLKVICYGKISVYEVRGEYQIYVERIEPKGLGALQLAFEQLKAKLSQEGLFDPGRKRPIPPYPRKVGIVTSPTGAAIRDILNIVDRRFAGIHILINPVRVQGEGSADEIARAIDEFNVLEDVDVLIVGRGGGSLEDLWAFNEETVARAIHRSKIPVISAVGHEVDWTIADMVADLRAPTPSAAAELVTRSREELERRIKDLAWRAETNAKKIWQMQDERVQRLLASPAFRQPQSLIEQWVQRVDEQVRQLGNYARNLLTVKRSHLKHAAGKLDALSPLGILNRGYSLTFDGRGRLLKNVDSLNAGEVVKTRLERGTFESKVIKIENQ